VVEIGPFILKEGSRLRELQSCNILIKYCRGSLSESQYNYSSLKVGRSATFYMFGDIFFYSQNH
jgi:hypothetical protein